MKKEITFLIGALGRGGMERQMTILMDGLVSRGYHVKLVTFLSFPDAYLYDDRVKRFRFDSKCRLLTLLRLFFFFRSKQGKNDVIISFGRLSCEVAILTNLFHRFKFIAGERNFSLHENSRGKAIINMFRLTDAVVTNSYSQKKFLEDNFPFLKRKVSCITNYTDINLFYPYKKESGEKSKYIIIGVFARLHPQKNCINFVDAIKRVKSAGYENIIVRWYGGTTDVGETKYMQKVSAYIKSVGLDKIFFLLPPVNHVANEINKCNAICLPSLFEGFSNSISEAICCGKPVLASNISDNHLMVEHGVNGFLFNPVSPEDMAEKIMDFMKLAPNERDLMSVKSREKAESLFNLTDFVDKYEEIIQKI